MYGWMIVGGEILAFAKIAALRVDAVALRSAISAVFMLRKALRSAMASLRKA